MSLFNLVPGVLRGSGVRVPAAAEMNGAWFYREGVQDDGTVLHEGRGFGTERAPQPRRCFEFDSGASQYIYFTLPSPIATFPFSLFGWCQTTEATLRTLCALCSSSSSSKYFTLSGDFDDRLYITRRNPTDVTNTINISSLPAAWSSFVAVFDSPTTFQAYRNGELVASLSGLTAVSPDETFDTFAIATTRIVSPALLFNGKIANVGYSRQALTPEDAQIFHANYFTPKAENFFKLDDTRFDQVRSSNVLAVPAAPALDDWELIL